MPDALPGGWLSRDTVDAFADYASHVGARFGDRVALWLTHNEPWCQAFLGYETGPFAPGHTDFAGALRAAHHLLVSQTTPTAARSERGRSATPAFPPTYVMA
ncbi:family 1 glycosylhydrolase [Sorangium sp. So ce375]|uniref:family 1 glycosylhydrolase n=1 Tax=Sorangium sp. So ce375 TaxID=3133306 RepID=UPI003F5CB333